MILNHLSIENVYLPAGSVPPVFHLTSCSHTKSNLYFEISFSKIMREPVLFRFLTFHVPDLISIFLSVGRLSKKRPNPRLFVTFRHNPILYSGVSPKANPHTWGTPIFGCPRLFIQHIRSYPPYLEAVYFIRNLRTRHALATNDPLNMEISSLRTQKFSHRRIIALTISSLGLLAHFCSAK
jgi:hypothetical protein